MQSDTLETLFGGAAGGDIRFRGGQSRQIAEGIGIFCES